MSTDDVNRNVNNSVKMWGQALIDAEKGLNLANKESAGWKQTVQIIRNKIAEGQPWPGSQESDAEPDATRN